MRKILCFLLAVLMTASLCGCAQTASDYTPTGNALEDETTPVTATEAPEDDALQELNMIYYKNLTMNPYKCADYTNRALFSLIYQGLFTMNPDYHAEPVLCDHYYVSDDMYTYTFYVDTRATFSDGTHLTPEDVAASLRAAMFSDVYRGRFYYMESVDLLEDGGVMVSLFHPYEDLPLLLDVPIVKASQVENDHPLGTGPYSLVSTITGGRLIRRSNWWCQAELPIDLPFITLMEAKSTAQIRDEFQFRDLNLVCTDPGSGLYADYLCDYELWDCENGYFLYLACKPSSLVFSNVNVKAALTYAIDRDYLVDNFYHGHARSASIPASPNSPYYNTALASRYSYAPEKFAAAVEAANLKGAYVSILVNADDSTRLQATKEIGKMLEAGGLQVSIDALGSEAFMETLIYGDYDMYVGSTQLSANMDLSQFFYAYGSLSYAGIENEALYAMSLNALSNSGNYYNLHRQIMDTGALIPILFRSYAIYATRGMIKYLNPARDAIFYYSLGRSIDDAMIPE